MYIYGIHPVEVFLETAADQVETIYCDDPAASRLAEIRQLADRHDLSLRYASDDKLDEVIDGGNHQGVVVQTQPFEYVGLQHLLRTTADKSRACVMVLDQIQDPQNLGAILRSAAAMQTDGVIVPKDRAAGVTAAVVRASAGQALRVPVTRITNVARTLETLQDAGWWTVGAVADTDSTDIWDVDYDMKTALVVGSEHGGIRRLVAEKCDFQVRIPTASEVDSLNVASAASILAYEVRRQWAKSD